VKQLAVSLCAALGVVGVLAGCSGASNSGGDTTCKDFVAMRSSDQDATVAKLLKERNGRNASTSDVVDTRLKLVDACAPSDKQGVDIGTLA
jgi:acid stress chaperone HdeA